MSYRNWLPEIGIGIGLIISILLALNFAELISSKEIAANQKVEQTAAEQSSEQTAEKTQFRIPSISPANPTAEHVSGGPEHPSPSTNNGLFWGDGVAQWSMAATGILALLLSAWAVWLIRGTLRLTAETLDQAREATKAAQEAVYVTSNTAKQQLRAYISAQSTELVMNGTIAEARVGIKNCGQTPAIDMRSWSHMKLCRHHECQFEQGKFSANTSAGPASLHFLSSELDLTNEQFLALKNGEMVVYLWGVVEYRDIFGELRFTNFRSISTRELKGTYRFTPCEAGNDSN
jgi:hypothetical protein